MPGSGVYHPQNDLSNEGKYVLSKHIAAGQRKFLDGRRLSFTELAAKRSFSMFLLTKRLDLVAIDLPPNSDNTIFPKKEGSVLLGRERRTFQARPIGQRQHRSKADWISL